MAKPLAAKVKGRQKVGTTYKIGTTEKSTRNVFQPQRSTYDIIVCHYYATRPKRNPLSENHEVGYKGNSNMYRSVRHGRCSASYSHSRNRGIDEL